MSKSRLAWQVACGVAALAGAWALVGGHGRRGGAEAEARSRRALAELGYQVVGAATVTPEGEHDRAWALERARPGEAGLELGTGEGGAYRWRVVFQGGGEVQVTEDGRLWSLRRPLPTAPGAELFRPRAGAFLQAALACLVPDPGVWQLEEVQTWEEEGRTWYRGWFLGDRGDLPRGWRRAAEVEVVGSSVIAFARHVQPLGTDMGVVQGRSAELETLRLPALVGLGLIVAALLVTGVGAVTGHRPVAWLVGGTWSLVIAALGLASGQSVGSWGGPALAVGAVMALMPALLRGYSRGCAWGAFCGVGLAAAVLGGRALVLGAGWFLPWTAALPRDPAPIAFLAAAWLPALVEEPVLRGVLPALARPLLGWWGAALLSVPVGALLHPLPSVPLAAGVALEAGLQLGLVGVARLGGVLGAVAARVVIEALGRRAAYPAGWDWDLVALAGVLVGWACLLRGARH